MTSVPPIVFSGTGPVFPAVSSILAGRIADINQAFGGNLNPALNTPQGQLAQADAAIIEDANDVFAWYLSQTDPRYATGRMQDAIGFLYFLTREPAEATVLSCTVSGGEGVIIPVGALIADTLNNVYACTGQVTISGGSAVTTFANRTTGPYPVPGGSLSIYQAIPGWDSVTLISGTVGTNTETQAEFEFRRQNSVALNAHGTRDSIYAAVSAVPGVLDVYVLENDTGDTITKNGVSLTHNSIYVCVIGGVDTDIGQAIKLKKDGGCTTIGSTSVTVPDSINYSPPYPEYIYNFQRPTGLAIKFAVTITNNAGLPSDIINQVKATIMLAFNGLDGGPRARIGATVLASRYYAGIQALSPLMAIQSILIGTSSPASFSVAVDGAHNPTLALSDISVTLA